MSEHCKVAIVTGAGTGVGRATALAFLRERYCVVLAGRRYEPLAEVLAEAKAPAGRTLVVAADVSDPVSVRDLFARTREAFGRLDLLFNNAGTNTPGVPFEDLTVEQWQAIVNTNLTGAFLCSQEAFRMMKAQDPRGGRIVNNGSISAHSPRPNSAPYPATKHAITGLTKSLALDGRKYDIACGQIDIGNARTPLAARLAKGVLQANGDIVAEPMIDPELVANAVVHMAGLPLDANIFSLTIMATKMPFVGRG